MSETIENTANKRRIAKNTLFLYFRMLIVMAVSLFTQRVVLDKLGATDYGIYYAVGGVVAMLNFLNGTLSTGTSRFLTFELGRRDLDKLKNTFSTAFYSHLILAAIVSLVLLTGGVWFVENKLVIPTEKLYAAIWVLIVSVLTTFVSITQVPYTSVIIARENMSIYAYIGLFEAFTKLVIVYLLSLATWDKLIFYSILISAVQISVAIFYRFYCILHYDESHLLRHFDRSIFKNMMSFSSWSLIANISFILSTQGLTVLMGMFFSPVIVAAQGIGNQINSALSQFKSNFTTAINPQIIKLYSVEQYTESRKLTLESSIYVFDLMLLLSLPVIVLMKPILEIWLVEVPEYAVVFSQWILISNLFSTYTQMLYVPMIASGRLKENSYASVFVTIFGFIALYFMFRAGWDVMWIQYMTLFQIVVYSYIVKPIILYRYIPDYKPRYFIENTWQMLKIAIIPFAVSIIIYKYWSVCNIWIMALQVITIMATVCIAAIIFMDKLMRQKLLSIVRSKIHV